MVKSLLPSIKVQRPGANKVDEFIGMMPAADLGRFEGSWLRPKESAKALALP